MPMKLANDHSGRWILYGATGVTGGLVLAQALARGHRPILAGRNSPALTRLGAAHDLEVRAAALEDKEALGRALAAGRLIVNVAGPFARSSVPLINAALASRTPYIDLSGEFAALEGLLARDAEAKSAGIVLIGGAGFGVAATDSLAVQVSRRLGGAEWLRLSVAAGTAFSSPAVSQSTLAVLAGGGVEIEDGQPRRRPLARARWKARKRDGTVVAFASAPLAELAAARRAVGARRIIAGVPMATAQALVLCAVAPVLPTLLRVAPVRQSLVAAAGHAAPAAAAPTPVSRVWVEGRRGSRGTLGLLEGGEGYAMTAELAVLAAEAVLSGQAKPGAHTPATAFGPEFAALAGGVSLTLTDI